MNGGEEAWPLLLCAGMTTHQLQISLSLVLLGSIACADDSDGAAHDGSIDAATDAPSDASSGASLDASCLTARPTSADGGAVSYEGTLAELRMKCVERDAGPDPDAGRADVAPRLLEGRCSDGKTFLGLTDKYTSGRYYFSDAGFAGYAHRSDQNDVACGGHHYWPEPVACAELDTRTLCYSR